MSVVSLTTERPSAGFFRSAGSRIWGRRNGGFALNAAITSWGRRQGGEIGGASQNAVCWQ